MAISFVSPSYRAASSDLTIAISPLGLVELAASESRWLSRGPTRRSAASRLCVVARPRTGGLRTIRRGIFLPQMPVLVGSLFDGAGASSELAQMSTHSLDVPRALYKRPYILFGRPILQERVFGFCKSPDGCCGDCAVDFWEEPTDSWKVHNLRLCLFGQSVGEPHTPNRGPSVGKPGTHATRSKLKCPVPRKGGIGYAWGCNTARASSSKRYREARESSRASSGVRYFRPCSLVAA